MARVSDGTDVPVSPVPASSSNMGSLIGSSPDLEEQDTVPERGRRRSTKRSYKLQNCRYSCRVFPDSKIASRLSPKLWLHMTQKKTNIEQIVSSLAARVTALETNATSVSSGSGSARSWNILGHGNGSTATGSLGSHGPGSSDDNRNTRRRLDTFSSHEDEHARSAVLLRFPCEQYHTGITNWINNLWEKSNIPAKSKPVMTSAMQVPYQPDSYSSHEDLQDEHPGDALPAPPHLRWRRDALQLPQVQEDGADRNTCDHFPDGGLRCFT